MIPGEKIPFGKNLIEAYLVEMRSIGRLSGSPVFVRETLKTQYLPATRRSALNAVDDGSPDVLRVDGGNAGPRTPFFFVP